MQPFRKPKCFAHNSDDGITLFFINTGLCRRYSASKSKTVMQATNATYETSVPVDDDFEVDQNFEGDGNDNVSSLGVTSGVQVPLVTSEDYTNTNVDDIGQPGNRNEIEDNQTQKSNSDYEDEDEESRAKLEELKATKATNAYERKRKNLMLDEIRGLCALINLTQLWNT